MIRKCGIIFILECAGVFLEHHSSMTEQIQRGDCNMERIEKYYEGYDEESRLIKDNSHKVEFLYVCKKK